MHPLKTIGYALLLTLASALTWAQDAPNMVTNGSFEERTADGKPAAWNISAKPAVAFEANQPPHGQVSLKLERGPGDKHCLLTQRIAIKPNTGYRLRAYIRAPQASFYLLNAYDAALNGIASHNTGWARFDDWQELVLDFRSRDTDKVVNVGLLGYGPEVQWDHVRLWEDDSVRTGDVSPTVNTLPEISAQERQRGFLLFSRPLGDTTSALYVPTRDECTGAFRATCPPGERDTILVMIHALEDLSDVRIAPAGDKSRWQHARLFQLGYSQRALSSQSFIRYPLLLLPPHPVSLKAGETLQFAIQVHVPSGFRAAEMPLGFTIQADQRPLAAAQLTVRVPPVRLDPADISFFMYYSDSYLPAEVATAAYQAAYYRDMAEHGMNSVSLYVVPEDSDGRVFRDRDLRYQPPDPRHALGIEQRLSQMREAGLVSPQHPLVLISGGKDHYDWGAFRASSTITRLMELGRQLRWPDLLFYLYDEPNDDTRIANVRRAYERLYQGLPEARTVTAIDTYGIDRVGELYDVWISGLASFRPEMVRKAEDMGKQLWAYDCRHRGQVPLFDRYLCGLWAYSSGIKGLGQWAYYSRKVLEKNDDGSYAVPKNWDEWYMIASADGPVGTVGWEARREGIKDYRTLITLERLAGERQDPAAQRARALLTEAKRLAPVDAYVGGPSDSSYIWDFHPNKEATWSKLEALRTEALQLISRLQGAE